MNIDKEFKSLIPPLTKEEFEQLEKNILQEGCRDPLIVWGNVLVDGHNRHDICSKHGLSYKKIQKEFQNREVVKVWIINNQLGRRNLPDFVKFELRQKEKEILLDKGKQNMVLGGGDKKSGLSIIDKPDIIPHNTQKEIAEKLNWSTGKVAQAEVVLRKAPEEIKEKLRTGELTINKVYKDIVREEKINVIKENLKEKAREQKSLCGKVLQGDFFDEIDNVQDNSVDLMFVDPPYMILNEEWDKYKNLNEFMQFTEKWLNASMPKVKSSGRIYICFSQWYQFELYKLLEQHDFYGFNFGQVIIWNYRNNNQPSNRKEYRYAYEPIFYLYGKDAPELNFTPDTYGETQFNVWTIATPQSNFTEGKYHPAQKPIELLARIIKTGSKNGDLILDPFAGSGTTGVVAEELGRQYVLIEKDSASVEIAKGRINSVA